MPHSQKDLLPKLGEREKPSFLPCLVYLWRGQGEVGLNISFKHEREQALPARKDCIIELWEPLREEYLAREPIEESEVDLGENNYYVLVEVEADHLRYSDVAVPAMYEEKGLEEAELRD